MTVHLPADFLEQLEEKAKAAFPHEACALLTGSKNQKNVLIRDFHFSVNVTEGLATNSFEVDPGLHLSLQKVERAGGDAIVGVWHSHPDGKAEPSLADRSGSVVADWVWLITSVTHHNDTETKAFQAGQADPGDLQATRLVIC